jgi:hypothetical protein
MIKFNFCGIFVLLAIYCACPLYSSDAWEIKPSVEKGRYCESDILSPAKLAYLPIPITKEDYAFLQSIDTQTSIVIGHFSSGDRTITLITDKNSDGKVDDVTIYLIDLDRISKVSNPEKEYPAEKFAKMKREIIEGSKVDLNPNAEGAVYLKKIISSNSSVAQTVKQKNGYKIYLYDSDRQSLHRVTFYFADNAVCGSDLVFEVRYTNVGTLNICPAIKYSVYCRDSKDNLICDIVKDLSSYAGQRFSGSK